MLKNIGGTIALLLAVTVGSAFADPPPMPESESMRFDTSVSFEDFQSITSKVYNFAYALDMRDWELMRTVFDDKIVVDTSATIGNDPAVVEAEAFIWDVKVTETGFEGTQLLFGNPQVAVEGDTALIRLAFYGEHVAAISDGDNYYTIGGYEEWRLRRVNDDWKINGFRLRPAWTKGNRHVMNVGVQRGIERLKARGDTPPEGMEAHHKW